MAWVLSWRSSLSWSPSKRSGSFRQRRRTRWVTRACCAHRPVGPSALVKVLCRAVLRCCAAGGEAAPQSPSHAASVVTASSSFGWFCSPSYHQRSRSSSAADNPGPDLNPVTENLCNGWIMFVPLVASSSSSLQSRNRFGAAVSSIHHFESELSPQAQAYLQAASLHKHPDTTAETFTLHRHLERQGQHSLPAALLFCVMNQYQ